jgi:rhamnogalacturonyl hydrolase YesR
MPTTLLGEKQYLDAAVSACEFIVNELGWMEMDEGICLRYYPNATEDVHNSSMIGASLLARVHSRVSNPRYLEIAEQAVAFTVAHQTPEGGWYYGVDKKWRWIDSFHTAYVLEALDMFGRYAKTDKYA